MLCNSYADVVQRAGFESRFKTIPTTFDITFGANMSLDGLNGTNNVEEIGQISSRIIKKLVKLGYEGTWSMSGMLADATLIRMLFDTANKKGTELAGYTLELLDSNAKTLTIQEGYNKSNGRFEMRSARGCVPTSIRISCNAGEPVSISYDGVYAIESKESLTYADEAAYRAFNVALAEPLPYTFVDAELKIEDATVGIVTSINASFAQEIEMILGLNEQTPQCFASKKYTIDGGFVLPAQTMAILSRFYDATTTGKALSPTSDTLSLTLNFQKKDGKQIKLTFDEIILNTYETDTRINEKKNHTLGFKSTKVTAFVLNEDL